MVEWDLLRLRPLTLLDSYGGAVWSLALDAAGVTLAAACEDGQVWFPCRDYLLFFGITSKLKIFNKNYKGLGTTEKEKKQEETQTGR